MLCVRPLSPLRIRGKLGVTTARAWASTVNPSSATLIRQQESLAFGGRDDVKDYTYTYVISQENGRGVWQPLGWEPHLLRVSVYKSHFTLTSYPALTADRYEVWISIWTFQTASRMFGITQKKFIGILPTLQLNDASVARQLAVHSSHGSWHDPADVPHGLHYLDDNRLTCCFPLSAFHSYNTPSSFTPSQHVVHRRQAARLARRVVRDSRHSQDERREIYRYAHSNAQTSHEQGPQSVQASRLAQLPTMDVLPCRLLRMVVGCV